MEIGFDFDSFPSNHSDDGVAASAGPPSLRKTPRVLVVDDDPNVGRGMKRTLMGWGYEMSCASDAIEALDILKDRKIHVIVTDQRMPGQWGTELLQEVRALYPYTVRILLTGSADLATAVSAINKGEIFRFLEKPCDPELLRATIDQGLVHTSFFIEAHRLVDTCKRLRGFMAYLAATNPVGASAVVEAAIKNGLDVPTDFTLSGYRSVLREMQYQNDLGPF